MSEVGCARPLGLSVRLPRLAPSRAAASPRARGNALRVAESPLIASSLIGHISTHCADHIERRHPLPLRDGD
jgi:hypothetical protein